MWNYEKRLQFPVNITRPNAKIAQIIISQYGGPDGEAAASFRYLSQRYSMPYNKVAGLLTDIGTEELAHLEMIAAIVRQLTKGLSAEEPAAVMLPLSFSAFAPSFPLSELLLPQPANAPTIHTVLSAIATLFFQLNFLIIILTFPSDCLCLIYSISNLYLLSDI